MPAALVAQLRELVSGSDSDTQQIRARLEGRLSDTDSDARSWVDQAVLHGRSQRIASTAVKTIEEASHNGSVSIDATFARWLSGLLATQHEDACARVARLLHSPERVADAEFRQVSTDVRQAALSRLHSAECDAPEPQLVRALLEDIVRSGWVDVVDEATVLEVWDLTARRAVGPHADPSHRSAALRDLRHLSGTLVQRSLQLEQSRALITTLLSSVVLDPPRSKARKLGQRICMSTLGDPSSRLPVDTNGFLSGLRALVSGLGAPFARSSSLLWLLQPGPCQFYERKMRLPEWLVLPVRPQRASISELLRFRRPALD